MLTTRPIIDKESGDLIWAFFQDRKKSNKYSAYSKYMDTYSWIYYKMGPGTYKIEVVMDDERDFLYISGDSGSKLFEMGPTRWGFWNRYSEGKKWFRMRIHEPISLEDVVNKKYL